MFTIIDWLEKICAVTGVVVCGMAGIIRLSGNYYFMGVQAMTLFTVGLGLMVLAVLLKLHINDME